MPLLDVSDILLDLDLVDISLQVVRQSSTVNQYGEMVTVAVTTPFQGVVVPGSGPQLQQIPDLARVKGEIQIFTQFHLSDGTSGITADQVIWNNRTYIVANVEDYSRYGKGFVKATCELKSLTQGTS